ncbi:hypothetical protein O0550_13035 [Brevibacillus halotolerans]|nr:MULTISPECIES: hypothetical protein [Brevibacillus]MCR8964119.1 hypothetical protein [Brevibacillus laterosporus]MCZ0836274.1 hypothetical protein [Brevibacillus halotolerans]
MKKILAIFLTVSFVICSLIPMANLFDWKSDQEFAAIKPTRDDPQG